MVTVKPRPPTHTKFHMKLSFMKRSYCNNSSIHPPYSFTVTFLERVMLSWDFANSYHI